MNNEEIDSLLYGGNANTNDLEDSIHKDKPQHKSIKITKREITRRVILLVGLALTLWIIFNIVRAKII